MLASSPITIVSGLPRSGTSMMMRMLEAGGMMPFMDGQRAADEDNPRGYYELEAVKTLAQDNTWVSAAQGQALKVISFLLNQLPPDQQYRVIFMRRALPEVLASQRQMLKRRGTEAQGGDDARMQQLFERHLDQVTSWLMEQPNMMVLFVDYARAVREPASVTQEVVDFLGQPLQAGAMTAAVERELYRQRKES